MKKTILLTSLLLITVLSFGQNKKGHIYWYDYFDASRDAGITYDTIYTSLFPDSTVISHIVDDSGTILIGNTNLHAIGQVFDPKFEFFWDPGPISRFRNFTTDSIRFVYKYHHRGDSSVDTLRLQFYLNAQVKTVNFSNGGSSLSVQYNWQTNRSTIPNFTREVEILLDSTNDTKGEYKTMAVGIPSGGLAVNADRYCAFTLSYLPGFSYNLGDTVDISLNPQKIMNQFSPLIITDKNKYPDQSGNTGLFINTVSRYNLPDTSWPNIYIPGHGYPVENRHFASGFYVRLIGSIPSFGNLTTLNIYPNPINNSQELSIDFELTKQEELTISIMDITGKVVKEIDSETYQQGQNQISTELAGLSNGMYYVNMIGKNGARTAQPIVIN